MNNRLYVGNLSYSVDDSMLAELFAPHGKVESAHVVTDRDTGQSKGFGFVEMTTPEEAQTAIEGLDGTDFEGRALRVNEAKPREDRGRGGPRRGGGGRGNW